MFNCYYCFKNESSSRVLLADEWFQIVKGNISVTSKPSFWLRTSGLLTC